MAWRSGEEEEVPRGDSNAPGGVPARLLHEVEDADVPTDAGEDRFGEAMPEFPAYVFPDWMKAMLATMVLSTRTPPDLGGTMMLAALAIACQGKARVLVRPGYHEQLSLYLACVMPSGSRKSAVARLVAAPISAKERGERSAAEYRARKYRDYRDIEAAKLKRLKTLLARQVVPPTPEQLAELALLREGIDELSAIRIPHLLTDDVTSERLSALLAENAGRMGVLTGEPGVFEGMLGGRFSVLLKGFSGDEIRVQRVSRHGETIPMPAVSIGLAMQPELLQGLAKRKGARDRGLLGRFLYSIPDSRRVREWAPPAGLHEEAEKAWHVGLTRLLDLPVPVDEHGVPQPRDIPLSAPAREAFEAFEAKVERMLKPGGELHDLADWGNKIRGSIVRIAGLLHLAHLLQQNRLPEDGAAFPAISVETLQLAIEMYTYFAAHARNAYRMMGEALQTSDAEYLKGVIRRKGQAMFLKQDCWQWTRGRFKTVRALHAALAELVAQGFLRHELRGHGRGRPGRPGVWYTVLPPHSAAA